MKVLHTRNLSIGYRRKGVADHLVLSELKLEMYSGEVVCVLGPNGSGKSTLIRTIAGLQPALAGNAYIKDQLVDYHNTKKLAQLLSVVLTDQITVRNLSVFDLAMMGRYPHTNWFGQTNEEDRNIVYRSLGLVGLEGFADRSINELSDGELQRAMIAKALVQETPVIFLDEPTAHLDLPNRMEVMQLLRKLAGETGKAILLSTHDLELALQTADLLWLIRKNGPVIIGLPEDLVLNGAFEATFSTDNVRFDSEAGTYRIHFPTKSTLGIEGNSVKGFWTRRAFEREGIHLDPQAETGLKVIVESENPDWMLKDSEDNILKFSSIRELLIHIKKIIE